MGRVAQEELKLVDAAAMLQLSYRKLKRMWRRYQQVGMRVGPQTSNRGKPMKLRRRVLNLIKKTQEKIFRFGGRAIRPDPSRRALADEDGIVVDHETLRRWMLAEHLWSRRKGKKYCQTKGAPGALWRAGAAGWAEVEMKLNDALARNWSCGYTLGMKTAISIPNDLFDGAERLARRTRRSRSRLFADALREYLARHAPDKVTESMDQAIMEVGEGKDEFVS
jgi:antitoxin MazE6